METPGGAGQARSDRGRAATIVATIAGGALVAVIATLGVMAAQASGARRGVGPASSAHIAPAATATTATVPALNCNVTPAAPGCGNPPPVQATPPHDWITLSADTPAAVLAVFTKNWKVSAGDGQYDLSRPETPVLARALHVLGAQGVAYDIWVIPFDSASGAIGVLINCATNAAHTAIACGTVEQLGTPRPHAQLAKYTQTQAITMAQVQSHVSLKSGARPYLIYAPIDYAAVATGKWSGGGAWDTPLWLVSGADGQDRVVADDGKVYLPAQLPVQKV